MNVLEVAAASERVAELAKTMASSVENTIKEVFILSSFSVEFCLKGRVAFDVATWTFEF